MATITESPPNSQDPYNLPTLPLNDSKDDYSPVSDTDSASERVAKAASLFFESRNQEDEEREVILNRFAFVCIPTNWAILSNEYLKSLLPIRDKLIVLSHITGDPSLLEKRSSGEMIQLSARLSLQSKQISELDLRNLGLNSLPKELQHFTELTTLRLDDNHLTELPNWLGNLPKLRTLSVLRNQLFGIPATWYFRVIGSQSTDQPIDFDLQTTMQTQQKTST